MEKLIELLDKFRRENKTQELIGEPGTLVPLTGKDFIEMNRITIISKEYEFIKWLVENDKIDLGKIKKLYRKSNENSIHTYPIMYEYSDLESLLMLLAIQDEPIRFLCEILK